MTELNLTPKRLALLKLLVDQGGEFNAAGIPDEIAPRYIYRNNDRQVFGWKPQGAVRWIHGYLPPMIRAGLVTKRLERYGVGRYGPTMVRITDKGRAVLKAATDG